MRLVAGDPQSVDHPVLRRATALDITEDAQRKIERLFGREDFRRVFAGEIGDIGFPPRALEQYTAALEATVDIERIRAARVQDGDRLRATASTSFVMPNVLAKLGADVLAVNPYASTAGAMPWTTATATPSDVADAGARRPAPTSARSSTPTASASRSSTTRATLLDRHRGPAGVRRRWWPASCSATGSPCR